MDLPPPPHHRRHHPHLHQHPRYESVLRPPEYFPPPNNPHHYPLPQLPPHTRSLNTLLPPPPPSLPPPGQFRYNMSPPPLPPRYDFSPPRYPIAERSHRYEFDPPPKPYFHPTRLPPPPPPPPRENIPLRVHDYPQRNPVFGNKNFHRGPIDNMREIPANRDRNMPWGAAGVQISAPDVDVGGRVRYCLESSELYARRDDVARRNSGISDWGSDLGNSRGNDERKWYSGMHDRCRDMYRDCPADNRRWDSGMNDRSRDMYREPNRDCAADDRRWDSGMNDRSRDMYREPNFDERRWDSGLNNQVRELYIQADDDERILDSNRSAGVLSRLGNRHSEFADNLNFGGVLSRLGNRQSEFSENDVSLGGVMSRLGNRGSEFAGNDRGFGGVLSRLGNTQPEFSEHNHSLDRFSGRLGVSKGEFSRKQRLQKKTQLGKVRSRHNGGLKSQHGAKDSNGGSFMVEEQGYGKIQTRMENETEREQSPMELAISFKSNSLVAKAIQVPSNPSTDLCVKSNLVKERSSCNASALPAIKSVVVSDTQFDSWGTSKEQMDRASDSGNGSVAANSARELGEKTLENAHAGVMILNGSTMGSSEVTCSRRPRKKKKGKKQRYLGANVEKDNNVIILVDASKPFDPNLKSESIGVNPPRAYEDSPLADGHFSPIKRANYGDSLGFNQHVNITNNYVHDKASVYEAEEGEIVPTDENFESGSDRDHSLHDDCKNSDPSEPSEHVVPIKDHDPAGLSGSQETRMSEVPEDYYFSEIHSRVPSLKSDCEVMKMTEDAMLSDVGSKDANSLGILPNQGIPPQVMLDAMDSIRLNVPAVKDCSDMAFDILATSCFHSENHKETLHATEVSSPNHMGAVLSHNINSVEGGENCLYSDNLFPKRIADQETCLSVGNSSKVMRKRKHAGAQMGLFSGAKADVNVRTVRLRSVVTRCFAEDIVPAMDGDFVGEKDICNKDTSLLEGSSGAKDSPLAVHLSAGGSFPGNQKRQKLSSPRSSLSSISEVDTIADGMGNNLQILEQHSMRPSEWGAETSGNSSPASAAISQCETTGLEGDIGNNDLQIVSLDENVLDGDRSRGNDDWALNASGILSSERNGLSASDSGDESLASSFDMRSCMTSPEDLHVNSDSCFLENDKAACQFDNEMISQSDSMSNKKYVFADPNTSSHGKCSGAAVNKSQTNIGVPQSLPKGTSQVVKKLYPVHSKLTWNKNQVAPAITKVLPVQQPSNFSNVRKLYSSHATKSRTWCRAVNSTAAVAEQPSSIPQINGTNTARSIPSSYIRKGNSLVRKDSPSEDSSHGVPDSSSSVYRLSHCINTRKNDLATDYMSGDANAPTGKRRGQINTSEMKKAATVNQSGNSLKWTPCSLKEPLPLSKPRGIDCPSKALDAVKERIKSSPVSVCQTDSVINSDGQSPPRDGNSEKKIIYVKRRSNQLVATCNSGDMPMLGVDNTRSQLSDGYYKSRGNQLLRASSENHATKGNANSTVSGLVPQSVVPKTSSRRSSAFARSCRYSKFSFVWKLQDSQSSEKFKNCLGPRKVSPHLFSSKRAAYWRSLVLGIKPSLSNISQKLLVSRKRGAIYTRSSHGYSLKMSKVLSVGGSSLKWSKSIEKSSRQANEEATRAVAAAEKRKKEEKGAVPIPSKSRNHVSRKWVLSVKLPPGERIFRIGSERYKMDPTRRTLQRITAEKEPSSSGALQSQKNVKRSYIPRRLLIGNEEYVRIGNGNQLVRDPKKRIRVLASEKVRWSLRTARLRLARKRRYCQFFTRFGKCNKEDGKCPYIHDPSKIVVCTKFLTGSCTNINCKLTHKVIPERMQDCSYFLKGSCSNENCPYRHVHVNPDSSVCESFLRGYCADGNECQKKHTYVCPAFEATGVCPQASACKLHHPKKKAEKKPTTEQKIVRGRYFDGGLIGADEECSTAAPEKISSKGKDNIVVLEGKFPDYISLEVGDDEADQALFLDRRSDELILKDDDDDDDG